MLGGQITPTQYNAWPATYWMKGDFAVGPAQADTVNPGTYPTPLTVVSATTKYAWPDPAASGWKVDERIPIGVVSQLGQCVINCSNDSENLLVPSQTAPAWRWCDGSVQSLNQYMSPQVLVYLIGARDGQMTILTAMAPASNRRRWRTNRTLLSPRRVHECSAGKCLSEKGFSCVRVGGIHWNGRCSLALPPQSSAQWVFAPIFGRMIPFNSWASQSFQAPPLTSRGLRTGLRMARLTTNWVGCPHSIIPAPTISRRALGPRTKGRNRRYHCRWQTIDSCCPTGWGCFGTRRRHNAPAATDGKPLIGIASAFDPNGPDGNHRFDPEGLRRSPTGNVFLSDEYGPMVIEFDSSDMLCACFPCRPGIRSPIPRPPKRKKSPATRRAASQTPGWKDSPSARTAAAFHGLEQLPLLQDTKAGKKGKRQGLNCRLLEFDLKSGGTGEYVYPLESHHTKLSEILAAGDGKFLVIERDGQTGDKAAFKKIILIDLKNATDTSRIATLPPKGLPKHVQPVKKSTFIDLLIRALAFRAASVPKRWRDSLGDRRCPTDVRRAVGLRRQRLQVRSPQPVLCLRCPARRMVTAH